jgi:hypothetical protein
MKYILALGATLLLVGCDERYRYPCQDPANWGSEECTKPLCDVTQTCPEYIFKDTPVAKPQYNQTTQVNRGGCK